jgi:hypothetical protein
MLIDGKFACSVMHSTFGRQQWKQIQMVTPVEHALEMFVLFPMLPAFHKGSQPTLMTSATLGRFRQHFANREPSVILSNDSTNVDSQLSQLSAEV